MKVPNLGEAHCGDGAEQSMQFVFPGRFCRDASCMDINEEDSGWWEGRGHLALGFRVDFPHFVNRYMQLAGQTDCYTRIIVSRGY